MACHLIAERLDGAKEQWALETNQVVGAACTMANIFVADCSGYLKSQPFCPAGGGAAYTVNAVGTDPTCPVVAANAAHVLNPPLQ